MYFRYSALHIFDDFRRILSNKCPYSIVPPVTAAVTLVFPFLSFYVISVGTKGIKEGCFRGHEDYTTGGVPSDLSEHRTGYRWQKGFC